MSCCSCCGKTGACCLDGVCTEETCQDCLDAGGVFQGAGTECVSGLCPCDPPADPSLCEKCVDGEVVVYCPEDKPYCWDGVCQAEECGECQDDEDCPEGQCCVDNECVDGYCHYQVTQTWEGEGDGTCPGGWIQVGTTDEGKVICKLCETIQEAECDDQEWYLGVDPGEGWYLNLNDLGVDGDCNSEKPCEECTTSEDCPAGECCLDGVCYPEVCETCAPLPAEDCPVQCDPATETCCPGADVNGCCPEPNWICCPDGIYCAATYCDCPEFQNP
jgi:hypothetical protein